MAQLSINDTSLKPGDKAPPFTLANAVGKPVSSAGLLKTGLLVVSFYRGAWRPYCNMELHALQQALPKIQEAGGQLIVISPNLPDKSLSSIEKHELTYEVLSDAGNKVAGEFGLVFSVGEAVRPMFQKVGFDIPGYNGVDTWEIPAPATYVIDTGGTIVYSFANIDYTQRAKPEEIVQALQKLKNKTMT